LILKFSAGKYKIIHEEFSEVSVNSAKIGLIVTKKPAITNDLVNDPRIKHHDWARKENLKSFAGYPLMYNRNVLGVFCNQISKELLTRKSICQLDEMFYPM